MRGCRTVLTFARYEGVELSSPSQYGGVRLFLPSQYEGVGLSSPSQYEGESDYLVPSAFKVIAIFIEYTYILYLIVVINLE